MDADRFDKLTAETAYLFRHAVVRDAAYELQLPTERAVLHALALDVIESVPGINLESVALELANHASEARRGEVSAERESQLRERESEYLSRGGDHARFNYDYPSALRAFERLHSLHQDEPAKRALASDRLADVLQRLGRWEEAWDYFEDVRDHAENQELRGRALIHLAWMGLDAGRESDAAGYAEQGEALAEDLGSDRLRIAFRMYRAKEAVHHGDLDRALQLNREAIELAHGTGDWVQEMVGLTNEAGYQAQRGDLDAAARANRKAEALADRPEARHHRINIVVNEARLAIQRRDWESALEHAGEAIEHGEATGSRGLLGVALDARAVALTGQGRYVDAFDTLEEVRPIIAETEDSALAIQWLEIRAVLLRLWGKHETLLPELEEAMGELIGRVSPAALSSLRLEIALCRAELRHQQEGLDAVEELVRERSPGDAMQVHYAAVLAHTGRHDEALDVLDGWNKADAPPPVSAEPVEFIAAYWRAEAGEGQDADAVRDALQQAAHLGLEKHPSPVLAEMLQRLRNWADSLDLK